MSRARFSLTAPFDVVLTGLLVAILAWALMAAMVMTSLAPLAQIVQPPAVAAQTAPCSTERNGPKLACRTEPTNEGSPR